MESVQENNPEKETISDEIEEQRTIDAESTVDTEKGERGEKEEKGEPGEDCEKEEVVMENEAFQIFEPAPNAEVKDRIVVRGLARVFEGTLKYEFEDGHFILDEGFTTASIGAPEWGEFEIIINLSTATDGNYRIVLYEESAKDGSNLNELIIPVQVSK